MASAQPAHPNAKCTRKRGDRRKIRAFSVLRRSSGVAKLIFWFGTPEEALEFPKRFLTYAMTYASDEDIEILRKYFTDDDFKATLDDPAPGIFDQSSWAKWNERYNRTPVPPLPMRKIPGVNPATVPDFFPASLEPGNATTPPDRRYQRWM
jgi:hypothetical protein